MKIFKFAFAVIAAMHVSGMKVALQFIKAILHFNPNRIWDLRGAVLLAGFSCFMFWFALFSAYDLNRALDDIRFAQLTGAITNEEAFIQAQLGTYFFGILFVLLFIAWLFTADFKKIIQTGDIKKIIQEVWM